MAGAAVNQPVDVNKEQEEIDNLIQSLLQFNPSKKSNESASVPVDQGTPKNLVKRASRGPGRPPKNARAGESPLLSPSPVVSTGGSPASSRFQELIFECLMKISNQNKFLIGKVNELNEKVAEQFQKIECLETKLRNGPPVVPTATVDVPPPKSEISQSLIENVVNRVEKIEGNLNSQVLLCRGPAITAKISSSLEGNNHNLQRIKAEVCKEILGPKVTEIAVDSVGINIFGKNKNSLKLECSNSNVRDLLLQQAKVTRPKGIFVAEFLSAEKLKIYNRLFTLKKQYPRWLKAVYTRRGSVFAVIGEEGEVRSFNSLQDVCDLQLPTTGAGPSDGSMPLATPHPSPAPPVDGGGGGSSE